jgi:hypothetical protein
LALALLKENKIEEAQKILSQSKSPQSKVLLKKIAAL